MEMPASLSMSYASRTTVPLALAHTLATIAFSHAVPVQNWFVVQAAPHWPQLAGSLAVSTHWPPQHVTVDGPVHEACASHGDPGAASAASAPASSEPASAPASSEPASAPASRAPVSAPASRAPASASSAVVASL